jgi:hypothetical protein
VSDGPVAREPTGSYHLALISVSIERCARARYRYKPAHLWKNQNNQHRILLFFGLGTPNIICLLQ